MRTPNSSELINKIDAEMAQIRLASEWTGLPFVYSGGCADQPRVALVFINPTARNQSVRPGWPVDRAPFIGLARMWRLLSRTGLLSDDDVADLPPDGLWEPDYALEFYHRIANRGVYVTNLVKACRSDATLPSTALARSFLGSLRVELEAVQPRVVVTMGGLVSSLVTDQPIKLASVREFVSREHRPELFPISWLSADCAPCYFPVGRGNPAAAVEILRSVARM